MVLHRLQAETGGTASTIPSRPQTISHELGETRHLKHVVNIHACGIFLNEIHRWAHAQLLALADALVKLHESHQGCRLIPSVEELVNGVACDAQKSVWRDAQCRLGLVASRTYDISNVTSLGRSTNLCCHRN